MINLKNIEYDLRSQKRTLEKIKACYFSACDNAALLNKSKQLRERAACGEDEKQLLPVAFALAAEAVKRTLGLTPHDNQLMAADAMTDGVIIELATGEGKTLAAVLTAYLKGLSGKGVHILTFNDYLAKRDALWMGPVYELLGMTAAYIGEKRTGRRAAGRTAPISPMSPQRKRASIISGAFWLSKKRSLSSGRSILPSSTRPIPFWSTKPASRWSLRETLRRIPKSIKSFTGLSRR